MRRIISTFDSFSATASFRVNGEPDVLSFCGGIVSLIVLGFFFYLFVVDMVQIFSYQKITAKENIKVYFSLTLDI